MYLSRKNQELIQLIACAGITIALIEAGTLVVNQVQDKLHATASEIIQAPVVHYPNLGIHKLAKDDGG